MSKTETTGNGIANSDEKVWILTNEWMARIEKAYVEYLTAASWVTWITISMAFFVLVILVGLLSFNMIFESLKQYDNFFGTEKGAAVIIFLSVCLLVALLSYAAKRIRQLHLLRGELADNLNIARELFQMLLALEENNAGSRYEYLVNHVRILEIKHLLTRVERTIGRSQSA